MSQEKINQIQSIINELNDRTFEIIGFDLGHGKTALAKLVCSNTYSNNLEPAILKIQGQTHIMTALAYDQKTGNAVIGEQAFDLATENSADEFEICFKSRPSNQQAFPQEVIKNFVQEVKNQIKTQLVSSDGQAIFFVGCPSGWSNQEAELYKQILETCLGQGKVVVIKESRAAFIHACEIGNIQLEKLKEYLRQGILVIDIGSSTTDFTFVKDKKIKDLGSNEYDLGGSLIDKEILKHSITLNRDQEKLNIKLQNKRLRQICEIRCRTTKEHYFSLANKQNYQRRYVSSVTEILDDTNLEFSAKVNGEIIDRIISQPLEELGNRSWKNCFYRELIQIRQDLMNDNDEEFELNQILLTGGGANMGFIKEICKDVFPKGSLVLESDHEVCVAKGLARYGRYCIGVIGLKNEIAKFLDEDLEKLIKEQLSDTFWHELIKLLQEGLIEKSLIKNCLIAWRDGEIETLNSLNPYLVEKFSNRLREDKAKKIIRNKMNHLLNRIKKKVSNFSRGSFSELYQHQPVELELTLENIFNQLDRLEFDLFNPDQVNLLANIAGIFSGAIFAIGSGFLGWFAAVEPTNIALLAGILSWSVAQSVTALTNWSIDEHLQTLIKTANLPINLRQAFLSEDRMTTIVNNIRTDIKNQINQETMQPQAYISLNKQIINLIKTNLSGAINKEINEDDWLL
ncbi:hypothetical protein [Nostoc sp. ChiSLP03a]|uniref:Hsp70 family protein n=1 Tax=Nostoc sp. ChiSLP03a TaxID=3075380 RepID=UPI002AD23CD1|nr:hypothetical protein [Nostoc sp. ChiSLP03a]MDZ8213942.1 hypothetical protein [Nostoc sp. ChiSLP03a]